MAADPFTIGASPSAKADPPDDAIPALTALLIELTTAGVRYCSWKSNAHLDDALAGRTDLDLLVDRSHAATFLQVVGRYRVRRLRPALGGDHTGIEHYLGFDRSTGRLFHLHVHYQLVLGQRHVKEHRVPLERAFLSACGTLHGVPVPTPELELALLAIRALLKYRWRDAVKDVLGVRSPGISDELYGEIQWLLDQTHPDAVTAALRTVGGTAPPDVIGGFLQSVTHRRRSGGRNLRLRAALRRSLRDGRRIGGVRATLERQRIEARRRRHPMLARMQPLGGGLMVALVGADGSGKSTLTGLLAEWLGWKVAVRVHYLGSKAPSRRSRWLYLVFRTLRRGRRSVERWPIGEAAAGRALAALRDATLALHALSIARDRFERQRKARREAAAGAVDILDRFPVMCFEDHPDLRLLDGPRIGATLAHRTGRLWSMITALEARAYRRLQPPDLLMVLGVSPAVATTRKPDHDPAVIAAKSRAADRVAALAEAQGVPVSRIDADQSLGLVLAEVKARLWDAL